MNKQLRTAVLAICTLTAATMPLMAQNDAPMGGRRGQMEERQVDMLTKRLSLSPDQQTQVKGIDDAQMQQMMAIRQDSSLSQDDRRSKMMALRQDTQTKIRAVLTDDQKTKYDALLQQQQARMAERRGGGGPPQGL
ncbi:MAG TPA: hypothetical protein VGC07_08860 [Granulicella sp.]